MSFKVVFLGTKCDDHNVHVGGGSTFNFSIPGAQSYGVVVEDCGVAVESNQLRRLRWWSVAL